MNKAFGKGTALLLILAFQILSSFKAYAGDSSGVGHGGGGDSVAAEFAKITDEAIGRISVARPVYVQGFYVDEGRLQSKFDVAKIRSVKGPLLLQGKVVVAINYPVRNEIIIDREKWPTLDGDAKLQLVIHEFLGLTFPEISDANYRYSRELADLVQARRKSIKMFSRLSAIAENGDRIAIGESIDWVTNSAKTDPSGMAGFSLEYSKAESYMTVKLISPSGNPIFQTKQFIQDTIDFESNVDFSFEFEGKKYKQLVLECQEALGRTP